MGTTAKARIAVVGAGLMGHGIAQVFAGHDHDVAIYDPAPAALAKSNASRAAEVASELILSDKVDLLVAAATPDTTNPVADQAEVNEVPCITTNCPWQPYFFGRKGDPAKGFNWTYHFFWGLEDVIAAFLAMWDRAPTNKVVGGVFPNDADGNAWGDPKLGLPPALAAAGYRLIDPGRYQVLNNDFTAQIIKEIRNGGISVIWIEHAVHALIAVVDRLVVLHGGRLIAEGEPQAVIRSPQVAEIYMGIPADA